MLETKICVKCKQEKALDNFYVRRISKYRKPEATNSWCKDCEKVKSKQRYHANRENPNIRIKDCWTSLKKRVKPHFLKIDFDLTWLRKKFVPLTHCPIYPWIKFRCGESGGVGESRSIDRIDSKLGYTKENVDCISRAANYEKNSLDPFRAACQLLYMLNFLGKFKFLGKFASSYVSVETKKTLQVALRQYIKELAKPALKEYQKKYPVDWENCKDKGFL